MKIYVEDNATLPNVAFELFADLSNVKLMFLITSNPVIETFVLDCLSMVSVPEVTDKENAVECVTSNTDDHSSVKQSSSAPANYIVGDGLSIAFKKITKSVKISLYLIFGSYKKKKPPKLSCLSRNRRLFFRIFFSTFNGFYCMRLYFLHLANLRTDDPSL